MAITEFTVASSNINNWAPVTTSVVGGTTKYGIYVTNETDPIYTFRNVNFYPNSSNGTKLAIVELYANSEAYGTGDPNDTDEAYDGVALINTSLPSNGPLWENSAVYGINANTKLANYVYSFTNKGYADTKIIGIGGNKNRRVFAIRSLGSLSVHKNQPYIAFIGDGGNLWYNDDDAGYSVGCVGSTRIAVDNEWVSHTAGDGTKYYSITNTTIDANVYKSISLTAYHTYRFTLHAHTEASYDGVAICKATNDADFYSLTTSQLLSGSTSTGKCSGKDKTTTFNYTVGASAETRYIYFKSDDGDIGPGDGYSFADVMVEDLGDLRATQTAPTAANVTVEYEETAIASASGGGGYGALQYRVMINPSAGIWGPWITTAPTRTEVGTIKYQAMYTGNASYKPSAVSNTATLTVIPRKIIKPTPVTTLVYDGYTHTGVNPPRYATIPSSPTSLIVEVSGTTSEENAGNYSVTYRIVNSNYCWADMTTAPITVNWSIAQLEAALSWGSNREWLYDGTTHSTTCTVSNLISGDECTVTLSNNSITEIGSVAVTATALNNSNYKVPSSKTVVLTIKPCMYVKAGGTWAPVIYAYKKENGSWVRQTTTIGSLFSTSVRYYGFYQDPNDGYAWKKLIDG